MRLSKQTLGGRLVATASCAALVLAVSFWVPDWVVRSFGELGVTIVVLLGVIAIIADMFMASRPAVLEDAHELSPLAFPPSEQGSWEMD